jgi:ATP-binding cassette subfamily C exporter for protease/lipase
MNPIRTRMQRSELTQRIWALRSEFLLALVFTAVINLLMLSPTLYLLQIFDRVLTGYSLFTLIAVTLVLLFFLLVIAFSEWLRTRLLVRTGVKFDEALNQRVFKASFSARLGQDTSSANQALADLAAVRQFATGAGLFAFFDAPWSPVYIAVLYLLHPWAGYIAIVFALLFLGMALLSGRVVQEPLSDTARMGAVENDFVAAKLRNGAVIESMGMLGNLTALWEKYHQRYMKLHRRSHDATARMQSLSKFLQFLLQSLSLGVGAWLVTRGEISPGAMIAVNVLMSRATQPLNVLVSSWRNILSARDAFVRLEALLERYPELNVGIAGPEPSGHIKINGLSALVEGRPEPILKDISLLLPAGTIVGVLGPSGAGKSTLARALLGIWPDTQGDVLLDSVPIQDWNRDDLGPHLGYLPQDVELFEGSIAENVARFAEPDSAQVIAACRRAGVHEMILRFPKGYDTPVGEGGSFLSGGQRQRIGLARALYRDPKILVLDEPNANLDDVGEQAMVQALVEARERGSTVVLITHRRQVVAIMDYVLVLRDGRVALFGRRDEVMASLQAPGSAGAAPAVEQAPKPA